MKLTVRIKPVNWHNCSFIVNYENPLIYGMAHYDGKDNPIDDILREQVRKIMSPDGFNQSVLVALLEESRELLSHTRYEVLAECPRRKFEHNRLYFTLLRRGVCQNE